jgi:hypothetical protein
MLKAFEFCLPTNGNKVPAGSEWLHEIKQDGFRVRVQREGYRVRLLTRRLRLSIRVWWTRLRCTYVRVDPSMADPSIVDVFMVGTCA